MAVRPNPYADEIDGDKYNVLIGRSDDYSPDGQELYALTQTALAPLLKALKEKGYREHHILEIMSNAVSNL